MLRIRSHEKAGMGWRGCSTVFIGLFAFEVQAQQFEPSPSEDGVVLPPVTLTARRQSEILQDAPISATVVDSETITPGRRERLSEALQSAPNTLFNSQGGPLAIRGTGSLGPTGGIDRQPGVGVFFDDVYIARPGGLPVFLPDLERVEILRGPQTLLYGRNTVGGSVNMVPRGPGADRGAQLSFGFGQDGYRRMRGVFDLPLASGNVMTRGFLGYDGRGDFIDNSVGEDGGELRNLTAAFQVATQFGDRTDARLSFDYSNQTGDGEVIYAPMEIVFDHKANFDYTQENKRKIGGVSLHVNHDLGWGELTSITALRGFEGKQILDGDFGPMPGFAQGELVDQRQFSQEFRLASTGNDPLSWRFGLYYLSEDFDGTQMFDMASVPFSDLSRNTFEQKSKTYAAYGQAKYDISNRLSLSGGLRYSYEERSTLSQVSSPSGTYFFGPPAVTRGETSFRNISPEIALDYKLNDETLLFGRVSRGFKAGGISQFILPDGTANRYNPESSISYEIGAKTTLFDDRVEVSASAFWVDTKDQQVVQFLSPTARAITNAGETRSRGLEIEGRAYTGDYTSLSFGYGYLDSKFIRFSDPLTMQDFSGNKTPFSPKHSLSIGLDFERPLAQSNLLLVAGLDYTYRSSYAFTPDNRTKQKDTNLLSGQLGLRSEDGRFSVTAFVENALDEEYLDGAFSFAGSDFGAAGRGRTVGLVTTFHF